MKNAEDIRITTVALKIFFQKKEKGVSFNRQNFFQQPLKYPGHRSNQDIEKSRKDTLRYLQSLVYSRALTGIIMISSFSAYEGYPAKFNYTFKKGGFTDFMRSLAFISILPISKTIYYSNPLKRGTSDEYF